MKHFWTSIKQSPTYFFGYSLLNFCKYLIYLNFTCVSIFKMLQSFNNTISLVFNILGMNIFTNKSTYFSRFRRVVFYALNILFFFTHIWIVLKPDALFGDRIFCVTFIYALMGSFIQLITLEINKSEFNGILQWIQHLYEDDQDPLVKRFGKDLYDKTSKVAIKIIR